GIAPPPKAQKTRTVPPSPPAPPLPEGNASGTPPATPAIRLKRLRFGPSLKSLKRFSRFCDSARGSVPLFREFRIQSALIGVFFAVDRRNVRRIFIEIGSPYPIFLAVRVDPLPQDFA